MAIKITQKEAEVLSRLAYMNFIENPMDLRHNYQDKSLPQIAQELYRKNQTAYKKDFGSYGSLTNKEQYEMLKDISENKYPNLSKLKLKDYTNQNGTNGLVAYAFYDSENPKDIVCAFRGSEGNKIGDDGILATLDGKTGTDWIDNFLLAFMCTSEQFKASEAFVRKNMVQGGSIFSTGHSKGCADTAYICAVIPGATGIGFDGPGTGQALTLEQRRRLRDSGFINIVNEEDEVGAILFHPEKRIFAKHHQFYELDENGNVVLEDGKPKLVTGMFSGHYLQGLKFDQHGNVLEGERSKYSSFWEALSLGILLFNEWQGEPLGDFFLSIRQDKAFLVALNTAIRDFSKDMLAIIDQNLHSLEQALNTTINHNGAEITKDLVACGTNVVNLRKELERGIQTIELHLAKVFQDWRKDIAAEQAQILRGSRQTLYALDVSNDLANICANVQAGDGIIEAIGEEKFNDLKQFLTGIDAVGMGIEGVIQDCGQAVDRAIIGVMKDCNTTIVKLENEWRQLLVNVDDIGQEINQGADRIRASVMQGLQQVRVGFIQELNQAQQTVKKKMDYVIQTELKIRADSAQIRSQHLTDSIGGMVAAVTDYYSQNTATGPDLKVTPERLNEVGMQLRRLSYAYDEHISGMAREVRRLVNNVNAEYDESYVRSASHEVWQEIKLMEDLYRQIREEMHDLEDKLKRAADDYIETEARIVKGLSK